MTDLSTDSSIRAVQSVAIYGSGLALWMSAAALARNLPDDVNIILIETEETPLADMLYGQVLPPEAYAFNLSLGISEPVLILNTQACFVYGTEYQNWAGTGRSWVQPFQQPLPVWDGVPLPKLVSLQSGTSLQDVMISAQAARRGVFAHPPQDTSHPLSRAEYGYVIDPVELTTLYKTVALQRSMKRIRSKAIKVDRDGDKVLSVTLDCGETICADLFIDTSGHAKHLTNENSDAKRTITVKISRENKHVQPQARSARSVTSQRQGWQSRCDYAGSYALMSVSDTDTPELSEMHGDRPCETITFPLKPVDTAWISNQVALGHAASTLEPISPAPMLMLMRDVERLISLFPVSTDMRIEAREYNRDAANDYLHAEIFNQAFFALPQLPDHPYWQAAAAQTYPELTRKLRQYESRGHLVTYDKEPFDAVAWAALHDGLGRSPARPDPLALIADQDSVVAKLASAKRAIDQVIVKMPPQHLYRSKFLSYLQRKFG